MSKRSREWVTAVGMLGVFCGFPASIFLPLAVWDMWVADQVDSTIIAIQVFLCVVLSIVFTFAGGLLEKLLKIKYFGYFSSIIEIVISIIIIMAIFSILIHSIIPLAATSVASYFIFIGYSMLVESRYTILSNMEGEQEE
ncbi:hypothetical protein [Rothia uropygialis]|uniref:hypothetical protein n=1 Tax=Kocuria sp. 36 TaxID=1415402 RepID=UPI00101CF5F3|nr:hypothetical protein [Kocuria sp. 36]